MQIPQSNILTTGRLGKVFSNTVATYKFFLFVSILQMHAKTGSYGLSMWDIPRYKGDVENPKGGVRGVIPSKQKY